MASNYAWRPRDHKPQGWSAHRKYVCRFCGQQAGGMHDPIRCAKQYQDRLDSEARARKTGVTR